MRRLLRTALWLALLAGAAAFAWWWTQLRGPEVALVALTRGTAAEIIYATGVVEPTQWAKVVPPVRARMMHHCRCEGRQVEAGDVLARLDESAPRAELAQSEARREFLAQEIRRQTDLVARGTVTRQTFERTQSELGQVEAQIAAVKARLSDYTLVAPMAGTVLRADGEVGEMVGTSEPLFWVGQPKPLQIVAEVNEEDIARVEERHKVLLRNDAFAGRVLMASVASITPKGDPVKKTFRVYFALPADTPLRIGMSVEANIVAREVENALVAPAEAVAGEAVFVFEQGRVRRRPVQIGIRGARNVQILAGIEEGARIVSPASNVRDGAHVRIKAEAAP